LVMGRSTQKSEASWGTGGKKEKEKKGVVLVYPKPIALAIREEKKGQKKFKVEKGKRGKRHRPVCGS